MPKTRSRPRPPHWSIQQARPSKSDAQPAAERWLQRLENRFLMHQPGLRRRSIPNVAGWVLRQPADVPQVPLGLPRHEWTDRSRHRSVATFSAVFQLADRPERPPPTVATLSIAGRQHVGRSRSTQINDL